VSDTKKPVDAIFSKVFGQFSSTVFQTSGHPR